MRQGVCLAATVQFVEVREQHAELRAPVTDVVLAHDRVAEVLEGAHERVTDGAAQVPDVHLLGEIRGGVVDHDRGSVADAGALASTPRRAMRRRALRH